jgi:hypothetical protein
MRTTLLRAVSAVALAFSASVSAASQIVLDFESFGDGDSVSSSIADLSFSGDAIATASLSLNEADFPPRFGVSVLVNVHGVIAIDFASPVFSVEVYVTYARPLVLAAYDQGSRLLGSVSTLFSTNTVLDGPTGSQVNERLQVTSAVGIDRVTLTSASQGALFALDDFYYDTEAAPPAPEPGTISISRIYFDSTGVLNSSSDHGPRAFLLSGACYECQ